MSVDKVFDAENIEIHKPSDQGIDQTKKFFFSYLDQANKIWIQQAIAKSTKHRIKEYQQISTLNTHLADSSVLHFKSLSFDCVAPSKWIAQIESRIEGTTNTKS